MAKSAGMTIEAEALVSVLERLVQSIDNALVCVHDVQYRMLSADAHAHAANDDEWQRLNVAHRHLAQVPAMLDRIRRDARERVQATRVRGRAQSKVRSTTKRMPS